MKMEKDRTGTRIEGRKRERTRKRKGREREE